MKKDFRVQNPLWQIGFMFIFVMLAIVFTGAVSNFNKDNGAFSYSLEFSPIESVLALLVIPMTFFTLAVYLMKVTKYNKENPANKLSMWKTKPFEYMEDDEAWQMITRKATQKVYTFFSWSLPFSAFFHLLVPTSKLLIIVNIVALSLVQNIIFYINIRRHTMEDGD